ncbi:MAG: type II secretion system protein N [Candidatus Thiodiazotropha sp.]
MRRLLLILCTGLLALIVYQWLEWPQTRHQAIAVTAASAGESERNASADDPPLLGAPVTAYAEIFDRSLFRADRTGFHAEAEPDSRARAPRNPPRFRLLGVILSGSEPSAAMILEPQQKKSRLIHVGDEVGEWRLESIAEDHVVMGWREERETVPLRPF